MIQRRTIARSVVASCATGLALVLTSCASATVVPVSAEVRAAVVALSALPPDLEIAHRLFWRDCMSALGWEVPFDATSTNRPRAALIGVSELFASESDAATFGYPTTTQETLSISDVYANSLPEDDKRAFELDSFGDGDDPATITLENGAEVSRSTTGCTAEADVAVYGSVLGALQLQEFVNELNNQSTKIFDAADHVLTERFGTYQDCMDEAGYSVHGLSAASLAEELFGVYRQPWEPPGEDERTLAITDFRCQDAAGFRIALDDLFIERSGAWIVENQNEILANREALDASLQRALAIVDG